MKKKVVYIIKCQNFYKIGITNDIKERLVALQTGNPFEISLVKTYDLPKSFETTVHELLTDAKYHERGEWFRFTDGGMEAIIELFDHCEKAHKARMEKQ